MDAASEPAADLAKARELLPAPEPGRAELHAGALRRALVELHDYRLASLATRAGVGASRPGVALLAVGALGRRELMPHSDLDLVLVYDRAAGQDIDAVADALWYPLWDAGIPLDHSVRTVEQVAGAAKDDIRTAVGLLDLRYLAGDEELAGTVRQRVRTAWRTGITKRATELIELTTTRWARCGDIAQRVEPDLKNGNGGGRDVALLQALAAAQVQDRPGEAVRTAYELLLDVRTELRRVSGRAQDVLRAQDADEVAAALGVGDRFDLARSLAAAGRTIAYPTGVALRAIRPSTRRPGRRVPRRGLDEGVVLHGAGPDAQVTLARDADPGGDPALLLRVAAAAAKARAPISTGALNRLATCAPELRQPWPRAAVTKLVELLGAGEGLLDVVETLDATGLWGRLFGEWSAIRDLPPRDAAHLWTVDRHLVQTCVHAAELTTTVSRPDLLLIGALLHDIGKGREDDHSVVGAALARSIGERLGLPRADITRLAAVVRHHLLLPATATRRDTSDPATVRRVHDTLDGDRVVLELLVALAGADSRATGPGVWTTWKARLIDDLAARCHTLADGGTSAPEPLADGELTAQQRDLLTRARAQHRPALALRSGEDGTLITVAAADTPGLLSRITGVLALHALEIHAATVRAHEGVAVDSFAVSPRFGSLPDEALLAEQLGRALDGSLPLADRIAGKERDYATGATPTVRPNLRWFSADSGVGTVVELRAPDAIGLAYRVAAAVEHCGLDLRWARAEAFGGTAVYSCGLTSADGTEPGTAVLRELATELGAAPAHRTGAPGNGPDH